MAAGAVTSFPGSTALAALNQELTLGGGYGRSYRQFGLACDNLLRLNAKIMPTV